MFNSRIFAWEILSVLRRKLQELEAIQSLCVLPMSFQGIWWKISSNFPWDVLLPRKQCYKLRIDCRMSSNKSTDVCTKERTMTINNYLYPNHAVLWCFPDLVQSCSHYPSIPVVARGGKLNIHTPKTNSSHLKMDTFLDEIPIGFTIHFQVRLLLVSGRVTCLYPQASVSHGCIVDVIVQFGEPNC